MTAIAAKRWRVGDKGFYYDPMTEDIKEVEVIKARYDYQDPILVIRAAGYDYIVRPGELSEGENNG